jgi:hypothetical protein
MSVRDISGIRLSDRERAALGKAMGIHSGNERRRHRRYMLPREFTLVVRVQQPGGTRALFSVTPRDMSLSGIGFFHASYIHPGTQCIMMMRTLKGQGVSIPGTVVRCRHVSGRIHEVGALFEKEIDVEAFVVPDSKRAKLEAERANQDKPVELQAMMERLASDLKQLVDMRASPHELLATLGEFALLLTGPEPAGPGTTGSPETTEPGGSAAIPDPGPSSPD